MADAKLRFTEAFKKPLPALYSTVVQELLVQQHLFRWNKGYKYTEVRGRAANRHIIWDITWHGTARQAGTHCMLPAQHPFPAHCEPRCCPCCCCCCLPCCPALPCPAGDRSGHGEHL